MNRKQNGVIDSIISNVTSHAWSLKSLIKHYVNFIDTNFLSSFKLHAWLIEPTTSPTKSKVHLVYALGSAHEENVVWISHCSSYAYASGPAEHNSHCLPYLIKIAEPNRIFIFASICKFVKCAKWTVANNKKCISNSAIATKIHLAVLFC